MDENDPLASLVVDAVELDRQRIADSLSGVVYIDRGGHVVPGEGFPDLNQAEKILAVLLGRKVAVLLELTDAEAVGPKDLASETGIASGSLRPALRRLYNDRLVSQDVDSGYYLSPHQVGTAISRLSASTDDGGEGEGSPTRSVKRVRRPGAKKSPKRPAAKTAEDTGSDGGGQNAPRKSKSAFSTTTVVRDLIEQGFFDSPKTLGDVQRYLKDKHARDVPITTLSPIFTRMLRSDVLEREKNDEGTYEYTVPS